MEKKITRIDGKPIEREAAELTPKQLYCVALLEEALLRAKNGQLDWVVLTTSSSVPGTFSGNYTPNIHENIFEVLGSIEIIKADLLSNISLPSKRGEQG